MKSFKNLSLIVALSLPCFSILAESSKEMIEKAPVLVIALDNSGSSPTSDERLMARAWTQIESKIRSMPLASNITVFTVGDASAPYLSKSFRIQKKHTRAGGDTDFVVKELQSIVLGFTTQLKTGKIATHGRSDLIGGFYDASKLLNPNAQWNAIIMVSDLIENSDYAICYSQMPCKLPKPPFALSGAEVTVLGVGNGLPSDMAIGLTKTWDDFLHQAGANLTGDSLKRVF